MVESRSPLGTPRRSRRLRSALAVLAAVTVTIPIGVAPAPAAQPDRPWLNTALSPDERAALLLRQMTLEEKVERMTGDQGAAPAAFYNAPIERLGPSRSGTAPAQRG